jgi:hypothetical protein
MQRLSEALRGFASQVHVRPIPFLRRVLIAIAVVVFSGLIGHDYVGVGLVNRGDELLRAGEGREAGVMYARAMFMAPAWDVPVDRFANTACTDGDPHDLTIGVRLATTYLAKNPGSENVRWDRGICYQHLRRPDLAYEDFAYLARAARSSHVANEWRYADIAANLAKRTGHPETVGEFEQQRAATMPIMPTMAATKR